MDAPTLTDLFAAYLDARRSEKLSEHTMIRYRNEARIICGHLGAGNPSTATIDDFTVGQLRSAFAAYADGHAESSTSGCWSTWRRFGAHLVREGTIDRNPMDEVGHPRASKGEPKALRGGEDTIETLLVSVARGDRRARLPWPERDLALIVILLMCGLRRSELAGLTIADMDPTNPEGAQVRVFGKGRKERMVPVPDEVLTVIDLYLATRWERHPQRGARADLPLIVNDHGGPLTAPNMRWIAMACFRAAGIAARVPRGALLHALRHTCATQMAIAGANASAIAAALGHEDLKTTQRYVDATAQMARSAVAGSGSIAILRNLRSTHDTK